MEGKGGDDAGPQNHPHACRLINGFSPITAVYYELTKEEIHRGSFWVTEFTERFGFCQWEILDISYAWMALDSPGKRYDDWLRNRILQTLGQPEERLRMYH